MKIEFSVIELFGFEILTDLLIWIDLGRTKACTTYLHKIYQNTTYQYYVVSFVTHTHTCATHAQSLTIQSCRVPDLHLHRT